MRKYRLLFLILVLPFLTSSCNGWLNVEPEDEVSEDKLFTTGNGFRHAMNGIYYQMGTKNLYGMQMTWGVVDALGQVYDYNQAAGVNEMTSSADYKWKGEHSKPVLESMWKETYTVVANCNNLIQQIKDADPEMFYLKQREKSMIWGEALAARAFLQFDMLRLFAPAPVTKPAGRKFVPYVENYPIYISNPKTVDECLSLIIRDLKEAKTLLWKFDSARSFSRSDMFEIPYAGESVFLTRRGFHLNYRAATALLARVYLYAQKEDEALEQANELIKFAAEKRAFKLADRTSSGDMKFYSDVIFGLHVIDLLKLNTSVNDMSDKEHGHYLCISEIEDNYFGADLTFRGDVQVSNDKRFTYWIEDVKNWQYYYRFKKYDAVTSGESQTLSASNPMVPMIRMTEIYYLAAEILAKRGGEDLIKAKSYLTYIKKGRGLRAKDNSMIQVAGADELNFMDVLINDMRREWLGEGQTFYLYKRLNKNIPKDRGKTVQADEKVFVAPIPDVEMNLK